MQLFIWAIRTFITTFSALLLGMGIKRFSRINLNILTFSHLYINTEADDFTICVQNYRV